MRFPHIKVLLSMFVLVVSLLIGSTVSAADYSELNTAYDLTDTFSYDPNDYYYVRMLIDHERDDLYLTTYPHFACGPVMLMRYSIDDGTATSNINECYNPCKRPPNVCAAISMAMDYENGIMYLGGRGSYWGGLHSYEPTEGPFSRAITGDGNGITWGFPWDMVFSQDEGVAYFVTRGWDRPVGELMRYSPDTGVTDNMASKLYDLWGTPSWSDRKSLFTMDIDTGNNVIYVAGEKGRLARYNMPSHVAGTHSAYPDPDTAYHLDLSDTSWENTSINFMRYDSEARVLYIAGSAGKLAKLTMEEDGIPVYDDLSGYIAPIVDTKNIHAIVLAGSKLFIGSASATFLSLDTETGEVEDLSGHIASFWDSDAVTTLAYDFKRKSIFLGGLHGKFARYNPVLSVPALVDIKPDTLNRKSKSSKNALTAYFSIAGHSVYDVDTASVALSIGDIIVQAQSYPTSIFDYNGDGELEIMVKFSRQEVIAALSSSGEVEMEISGLVGLTRFVGADMVKVIH